MQKQKRQRWRTAKKRRDRPAMKGSGGIGKAKGGFPAKSVMPTEPRFARDEGLVMLTAFCCYFPARRWATTL